MEFNGNTYPDTKLSCNREHMTILVEALESGQYPQARGYLRWAKDDENDPAGFCCAGVACEKSGLGTWELEPGGDFYYYKVPGDDSCRSFMPDSVVDWLGLTGDKFITQELPLSDVNDLSEALLGTSANDEGWDFQWIAARLREVYLTD